MTEGGALKTVRSQAEPGNEGEAEPGNEGNWSRTQAPPGYALPWRLRLPNHPATIHLKLAAVQLMKQIPD
jgi:hypothetical protein